MKIEFPLKAEASLRNIPLTMTNGLYASYQFDEDSIQSLAQLAVKAGYAFDPAKVHVTVMYSTKSPSESTRELIESDIGSEATAIITGIDHWVGHNGKTYVILRLQSQDLAALNAKLHRCGAEATILPYAPHITLHSQEDALSEDQLAKIAELNLELAPSSTVLKLINYKVGDLDG